MSDEQQSNDKPVPPFVRRRVARSASTAEAGAAPAADAPAQAAAPEAPAAAPEAPRAAPPAEPRAPRAQPEASGDRVTWDVRADRAARPPRAGAPRGAGPRGPRRGPPGAGGEPAFRRAGASGGRAMPDMPYRGGADRSSPDFVDKWLSSPQRPPRTFGPGDRAPRAEGEDRGPRGDRGPRAERGPRPEGAPRAEARPEVKRAPKPAAPPPEPPKAPTLHETILLGLPKVAVDAQRDKSANKPKTAKEALAQKAAQSKKPAEAPKAAEAAPQKVKLEPGWLAAGAEAALAALNAAEGAAAALVEAWIVAGNAAAVVEAAHAETTPAAARKAARRGLNVLRARKIPLPEPRAVQAAVRASEEEVLEATFTPPDGRGSVSITISKRRGGDRAHIAEVIMRDQVGIVQAVAGYMSRSQIREAHQRIAESSGVAPAQVPVEWARHRIARAIAQNAAAQQLVPLSFERCRELVEPAPASEPAHPLADLEAGLRDGDEAGAAGNALHGEPEFRGWVPDSRALDDMLRKVGQRLSPEEAQDSAKVDEILKEEIKAATDRFFTPEMRNEIARRMRDAAITVRARGGDAKATSVLLAARAVERAGLITSPPSDLEFLRAFFQKGVALLAQQSGGQLRVPMQR